MAPVGTVSPGAVDQYDVHGGSPKVEVVGWIHVEERELYRVSARETSAAKAHVSKKRNAGHPATSIHFESADTQHLDVRSFREDNFFPRPRSFPWKSPTKIPPRSS